MAAASPDPHAPAILRSRIVGALALLGLLLLLGRPLLRSCASPVDPTRLTYVEAAHLEMTGRCLSDRNTDLSQGFSEALATLLPRRCDGVVQPLWPWIAAFWHDPSDVEKTLRRSRLILSGCALGLLASLGWLIWLRLGLVPALWLVGVVGQHGLLPSCLSFGPALLFQAALLLLWMACLICLRDNSFWNYAMVGCLGALAWLLEDRLVISLLIAAALTSSLRACWGWAYEQVQPRAELSRWRWNHHLQGLLLAAGCFFFLCAPRLIEANQWFGRPFFSLWDEARWLENGTQAMQWLEQQETRAGKGSQGVEALKLERGLPLQHPQASLQRLQHGLSLMAAQTQPAAAQILLLALMLPALLLLRSRMPGTQPKGLHAETPSLCLFALTAGLTMAVVGAWDAAALPLQGRPMLLPIALTLLWAMDGLLLRAGKWRHCLLRIRDIFLLSGLATALTG